MGASNNDNVGEWLADVLLGKCGKRSRSPANENAAIPWHAALILNRGTQSVNHELTRCRGTLNRGTGLFDHELDRCRRLSRSAEAQAQDPMALPLSSLDSPLVSCPSRLPSLRCICDEGTLPRQGVIPWQGEIKPLLSEDEVKETTESNHLPANSGPPFLGSAA